MKKGILIISFFLLSFVIFGCSSSTTKENNTKTKDASNVTTSEIITMNKETMPDYSNNTKELVVSIWSGIQPNCAILKNDEKIIININYSKDLKNALGIGKKTKRKI